MNFKTLRNTLLIALPVIVFLCFIGKLIYNDYYWINWIYAVSLSGLVGLGTNSIAIRMLFRPKRPTCFGKWRQGILPRHQDEIADTIGEAAKREVMNEENIRIYIEQSTIIENTIKEISFFLQRAIENKKTRDVIHQKIIEIYNEYADVIFENLVEKTDGAIVDFFSNKWDADTFWKSTRPQIDKVFEKLNVEEEFTEKIVSQLVDAAPEISLIIKNAIVKYVSKGKHENPWEWLKHKLATKYVDDKKIKVTILKYIRDKAFKSKVLDYLENNIDSITLFLDKHPKKIAAVHNWIKEQTRKLGKEKLIPFTKVKIENYLNSDESWESMDKYIHKTMLLLISKIPEISNDEEVIKSIKKAVPEIMQGVDVKSLVSEIIKKKDPEEFERLIRDTTHKHLAAIEVLGGLLGMAAGLALINKWFVIIVPGILGGFLLIERMFTKTESKT